MRWYQRLFRRDRTEKQLDAELRFHLEQQIADYVATGMSPEAARRRARLEFGGLDQVKEECRDVGAARFIETLIQDIRYGLRQLRRNPGFTAVAIITLALGIGANTAIFSLIDAVILRWLPVSDPSQLVLFRWKAHHAPRTFNYSPNGDCDSGNARINPPSAGCSFTYPFFERVQSVKTVFSQVAAYSSAGLPELVLTGNGLPIIAHGQAISGDYFSMLGVRPALGRLIEPQDDMPGAPPVVVLSYAYWNTAFGGDRSAVGRTVVVSNVPFTIVGVANEAFTGLSPGRTQDLWLPLAAVPHIWNGIWGQITKNPGNWWLVILGRLKPGVPRSRAQAAGSAIFRDEVLHAFKPQDNPSISLVPAQDGLTGVRFLFSTQLYVLMAAVGLILLIACANVAGLLLVRAMTRCKEMAVRLAVGAGKGRIVRQLLTECVLLSLAGGALGIIFAYWGVHAITPLMSNPCGTAFPFVVRPDAHILVFTVAISVLAGILFGLAPALRSISVDLTPALKESALTALAMGSARRRLQPGSALVILQVGLSVVLLVGAGLLVRTLEHLRAINPGFDTRNVLLFGIEPSMDEYTESQVHNLYRTLQARFAALPGVISASYSSSALLSGSIEATDVRVEGGPRNNMVPVNMLYPGPGFFRTLRLPLLEGRTLATSDFELVAKASVSTKAAQQSTISAIRQRGAAQPARSLAPIPVLVNHAFVRSYLPNQNPLGERLIRAGGGATENLKLPDWQIVGVVGDAKYSPLQRMVSPTVYRPLAGWGFVYTPPGWGAYFELRTAGLPAALIPAARNAANGVNNHLPLVDIQTERQHIDQMLVFQRFMVSLASLFGAVAVLLACVGLYGLLSYEVTRRTHEFGIRMALGATRADVVRIVAGRGIRLTLIGIAAGILTALALTRLLASLLYGVKPTDPLTFIAVSLILLAVALLACYIPARRAAKVDPIVALRHE